MNTESRNNPEIKKRQGASQRERGGTLVQEVQAGGDVQGNGQDAVHVRHAPLARRLGVEEASVHGILAHSHTPHSRRRSCLYAGQPSREPASPLPEGTGLAVGQTLRPPPTLVGPMARLRLTSACTTLGSTAAGHARARM